jgi:hypothetical protein
MVEEHLLSSPLVTLSLEPILWYHSELLTKLWHDFCFFAENMQFRERASEETKQS